MNLKWNDITKMGYIILDKLYANKTKLNMKYIFKNLK